MTARMFLPPCARYAYEHLTASGFEAWFVGGCVRDFLLGGAPHDYDMTTSALPQDMRRVFREDHLLDIGIQHGTMTLVRDGECVEITTFRTDGTYLDGRHPASVSFTPSVTEDLKRRDFTVNAMAWSPSRGLLDPFGGREDLKRKIIRCVGDPAQRFREDALRLLRALRFAARLGFAVHPDTAQAILLLASSITRISRERIREEMTGFLLTDHFPSLAAEFQDLLFAALPELRQLHGLPSPVSDENAWRFALRASSLAPRDALLRWSTLLAPLNDPESVRRALESLKMPSAFVGSAETLVSLRHRPLVPGSMAWLLRDVGAEDARRLIAMRKALRLAEGVPSAAAEAEAKSLTDEIDALLSSGACWQLKQLAVNGNDLKALGLSGPEIGKTLNTLLDRVMRHEAPNDREELLREIGL